MKRALKIPYSNEDENHLFIEQTSKNTTITSHTLIDGLFRIEFSDAKFLYVRPFPHSDPLVFNQIFTIEEYKPVVDYFCDNRINYDCLRIVDAGANVGYTTWFLLSFFRNAQVICIEPDLGNLSVLKKNLEQSVKDGQVKVYRNALTGQGDQNVVIADTFRDGRDWALSIKESEKESDLKSVGMSQLMKENGWKTIDILKVDIEGSERFVFESSADLSYLRMVRLIALEIHDEFKIRENIYITLRNYGFELWNFGETTLAINRNFPAE